MIRFLQNKGKASKYLIGFFILMLSAAMVAYLVPSFQGDDGVSRAGVVAEVGGEEITVAEAQALAQRQARQQFGGRSVPGLMPFLVDRAIDSLIDRKAMLNEAKRMGLRVSDDEIRAQLRRFDVLFPNGNYVGDAAYEQMVQQQFQMTVPQFQEDLREQMLLFKLISLVTSGTTVDEQSLRQEFQRRNTKAKFDYAVLTLEDVQKQLKPTEEELKAYYQKNLERYKNSLPEKRSANFVLVDASKLNVQVTPEDLKRYYSQNMDQFRVAEQVKVRHILVKTPTPGADGKVDEKAVEAARNKAQDVLKQLRAGGNFAQLAKKYSDDTTAQEGGDLGWIGRGRTVPEFEKAAFTLNKGQISEVIQTTYGFHIIQLDDKQQARVKTLEEVREQIQPIIAREKAAEQGQQVASTVESAARTQGLEKAAQQKGLQVQSTGLIARNDSMPALGDAQRLVEAIFSVNEKNPPEAVQVPQGYAVFQVTQVQPAATPTFEQARQQVEGDFKAERAQALLVQRLQELADRARAQHNLRAAAKEVGATVKASDMVSLSQQVPDLGTMSGPASVVFGMKPGEISGPVQTPSGGAVIALHEKQEPGPAEFENQKDSIRDQLADQKRQQALEVFVSNLRSRLQKEGKIRINQAERDRIAPKGGNPFGD